MNSKTYLMTNSIPLLDNPKNILILEWLEGNSFCTLAEISSKTNIPLKEVSEIIQILYKNNLVTYNSDKYEITIDGINLLDKLGLSDLQISTLLNKTDFQPDEYSIYKSIFHEWRSNFLSIYLFIFDTIENKYDSICMPFSHIVSSSGTGHSILIASLFHKLGQILYMEETSNLMKYYTALYEYSFKNHCLSSEIYHTTSKYWNPDKEHIILFNHFHSSAESFIHKLQHYCNNIESNDNVILLETHNPNNINYDFSISYNLITHPNLLSKIFIAQNLAELSKEFNWTESQAKFILKSIRSKIDTLLQPKEINSPI